MRTLKNKPAHSINIAKKEENPSMLHFMRHECCLSCRTGRVEYGFFIIQ